MRAHGANGVDVDVGVVIDVVLEDMFDPRPLVLGSNGREDGMANPLEELEIF